MRETFHLVPLELWVAADAADRYVASSFAAEGFVHCTDGIRALGETFDRHYAADPREFAALTVDLDALDVPWRYDDPGSPYPHVYGSIARSAIIAATPVRRDDRGHFAGLCVGPGAGLGDRAGAP